MLTDMIVAQTVYALKSCSIQNNEHLRSSPACLVVSTIIRRMPVESSSIYQVYRLTPLPVFFKGEKYVYSDLPVIVGFNNINKKVILWNDDNLLNTCAFSKIVQCHNYPVSIPLSTLPCLNELFDNRPLSMSTCQVRRSNNVQPNILNIKNNIWFAYPSSEPFECESQSLSSPMSDIISINEPMIVTLPCDRPVQCSNILLPSTACVNTTVTLTGKINNTLN
ncbi:unnamed protein product [Rotaria sp. Silwood2]|nr:unnamed protein product [Rotaria sp. Silwood2]CAF2959048.1 unnamed protein product [Rotaria sp. Silwood2]CAF3283109.1 unnamed protein product [Rotaria sp. Silwood2]CAF3409208.1 unnamed protein product [Rotaria sp. Silwood2]CAF4103850.1 unnamed protein product [Rotaria sp. Silwood2]